MAGADQVTGGRLHGSVEVDAGDLGGVAHTALLDTLSQVCCLIHYYRVSFFVIYIRVLWILDIL